MRAGLFLLIVLVVSCNDNLTIIDNSGNRAVENLIEEPANSGTNTFKRGNYTGTTGNGVGGTISNPSTFSPGNFPAGEPAGGYSGNPSNPTGF